MKISQLENVTKVVVHANCPDGMASAIILKHALKLSPEQIVFVQYHSIEYKEIKAEPGLLFCDCIPPQERTQEFVDVGTIVLDHHKSSKEIIAAYGENGVFADKEIEPEVSGAWLAFREVWQLYYEAYKHSSYTDFRYLVPSVQKFVKSFAVLAGIRDNWQINSELWKESCEQAAILMFFSTDFWMSKNMVWLSENWCSDFEWLGPILVSKEENQAKSIADKRWTYRINSGLIIAIIPSRNIADAAQLLEDECSVVIGFNYTKNKPGCFPELILSLRSFENSFDCERFCTAHGGGGHVTSAGCRFETTEDTPNPYTFICEKFDKYVQEIEL